MGIKLVGGAVHAHVQIETQPAKIITNSSEAPFAGPAFDYAAKTITVHLDKMDTGRPYVIVYRGAPTIAIKHSDGKLGFYRLPKI